MSLTQIIKLAKSTGVKDYFCTGHFQFTNPPRDLEIINPYPQSLYDRRLWTLMGTFTDYMIRKMFRDGRTSQTAAVSREHTLVSEQGLDLAAAIGTEQDDNLNEILDSGQNWIDSYLARTWEDCIEETFLMCQLDSIYRAGQVFQLSRLTSNEVEGIREYLSKILVWLQTDFGKSKQVILNPVYGHPDICRADGDLVIDSALFDIKTTINPVQAFKKDKNQLLGYISLAHYHSKRPISSSPPRVEYEFAGFLFPLSLKSYIVDIKPFSNTDRERFCEKIIELYPPEPMQDYESENHLSEIEQMIKKKNWEEASERTKKLLESNIGTLVEWDLLLKALGDEGEFSRLVELSKYLEANESRLTSWTPIFGDEYRDDFQFLIYNVGASLAEKGDPEYALHCFEVFLERMKMSAEDDEYLSLFFTMIYARLGNEREAMKHWKIAENADIPDGLKKSALGILEKEK